MAPVDKSKSTAKSDGAAVPMQRHRRLVPGTAAFNEVRRPQYRRLCRRAGVQRVQVSVYDATHQQMLAYMRSVIGAAVTYTQSADRKTVRTEDVRNACRLLGQNVYPHTTK